MVEDYRRDAETRKREEETAIEGGRWDYMDETLSVIL